MPSDWHLVHLGSRALGGAALVMAEMTDVTRRGAHHARLRRHVPAASTSTAGAASSTSCTATATAKIGMQLAHAGRKGGHDAAVAGRRAAAAPTRRGRSWRPSAIAVPPRRPGAARDDRRRHARRARRVRARGALGRRGRLRPRRAARRARLSARQLPLAADQPPRRRATAAASRAGCASRSRCSRRCAPSWPDAHAAVGAHLRHRLGAGRHHARRHRRHRARAPRARLRHRRRLDRRHRRRGAPGRRPPLPDAVRRAHPPRRRRADDDRRQHLVVGRHQQHPRRRPRRPVPAGAHAPVRPVLHAPRRLRAGRPTPDENAWPIQYDLARTVTPHRNK